MSLESLKRKLSLAGQEHLVSHWDQLSDEERDFLAEQAGLQGAAPDTTGTLCRWMPTSFFDVN